MILLEIIYHLSVLMLCALTLVFLERKIAARAQHRVGFKKIGFYQVLADAMKNFIKNSSDGMAEMSWLERANIFFLLGAPILFYLVLTMGTHFRYLSGAGVLILFIILMVAAVAENFFLFFQSVGVERYRFRNDQFINFEGLSVYLICILVPMIRAGSCGFAKINDSQESFPFLNVLSSPGLFLSAALSFLMVFYICGMSPVSSGEKKYKGEKFVYLLLCSKRLWLISLISFWLFLFWGGGIWSVLVLPFYLLTTLLTFFLIFWLETALSAFRAAYSIEIIISRLLPLALLSVICEVVWRALLGGVN